MSDYLEQLISGLWNRFARPGRERSGGFGASLGRLVRDGSASGRVLVWPNFRRPEHLAVLGKTGTGKSSLLKHLAMQDIREYRGFAYFDLHGDTTRFLLRYVASEERRRGIDLSGSLIVIEPGDAFCSVGLNVIERGEVHRAFVQIAEVAKILRQRWGLEHFGARTEELLRNSLIVLSDCALTLIELAPLLTDRQFRAECLARSTNPEARRYFEDRYDEASEAMQATIREALLNKVTGFTSDPALRHIVGQASTFSLVDAIDEGRWIILDLDKGRLGEQAATLGSLFLTKIKNAIYARRSRNLFTIYADEIQNLVTFDSGVEILLSEARKFAVSVVSANQFLDQYPPLIRSAILSVASHVLFRLSSVDAEKMAAGFGGGKWLAEILRNLPHRQFLAKIGDRRWAQAMVPDVVEPNDNPKSLHDRIRRRWAKRRSEIEADIERRQPGRRQVHQEVLHDWE